MQKKQEDKKEVDQRREAEKAVFTKLVEQQRQGHDGDIVAHAARYER
ncbi:MAG: hypothetical protein UY78_C0046G0008 [Parcubacteria group bacterium GW2011_GWA1_53_13]|nr:MAG: hypothetical protein UY78_C0046G0008 [Parcubacteria group bacterium GW2011_GWA1_53_13]